MKAQNIIGTIGATNNIPTVGSVDKQLLKRMKKSAVKPIGRTIGSFKSLRFMSNEHKTS